MDIITAATIIFRRLWVVALCGLVALGAAALVNTMIERQYEAVTLLAVNQIASNGSLTDYDTILANESLAKSYAQMVRSRAVLTETISRLNLETSAGVLRERVTATLIPETQLLRLEVVDSEPQRAADIANTLVAVFREQNQGLLSQRYATARQGIETEMLAARESLDVSAKALDQLRSVRNTPEQQLRDAEIKLNQDRNHYTALSEALAKLSIAETQAADSIDVIELAYPSSEPVWPNPALNLAVAAVAGLGIGAFVALILGKPRVA